MEMKRKLKRAKTFYCYFCRRHILITFVGMTLLIVNYGVNTVQMSAVPHRNESSNSISDSTRGSSSDTGNNVMSAMNSNNLKKQNNLFYKMLKKESIANTTSMNSNRNTNIPLHIPPPVRVLPTSYKNNWKTIKNDFANKTVNNNHHNNDVIGHTRSDLVVRQFDNFRKSRIFGLFGTNFSLSYNLSLATGNSAGNITVAAPAPTYYYAPASYYPYGYYDPYGYYNPYAYNPYAYNPYAGYGYYG